MSGIKSMYVDSSACVRVRGGENEQFRLDIGVRKGVYHVPLDGKEGSELPEEWERLEIAWSLVCR